MLDHLEFKVVGVCLEAPKTDQAFPGRVYKGSSYNSGGVATI